MKRINFLKTLGLGGLIPFAPNPKGKQNILQSEPPDGDQEMGVSWHIDFNDPDCFNNKRVFSTTKGWIDTKLKTRACEPSITGIVKIELGDNFINMTHEKRVWNMACAIKFGCYKMLDDYIEKTKIKKFSKRERKLHRIFKDVFEA